MHDTNLENLVQACKTTEKNYNNAVVLLVLKSLRYNSSLVKILNCLQLGWQIKTGVCFASQI